MNFKTLLTKWGKRIVWFLTSKDERVGKIYYALQRACYGYSDEDVYSIDWWLSEVIPPAIDELITRQNGCPGDFLDNLTTPTEEEIEAGIKKWEAVMYQIRDGFIAWNYFQNNQYRLAPGQGEDCKKKFLKGIKLMGQYFHTMWW